MTKHLTILLVMLSCACFAQDDKKGTIKVKKVESEKNDTIRRVAVSYGVVVEDVTLSIVEQMPEFPGGVGKMKKFISENLQYPQSEKESAISGTVYITFVVEIDGSLTDIKVLRGIPGGPGCDKEALRVVKIMPKWVAGKQNGRVVRVRYNLPIKFFLK